MGESATVSLGAMWKRGFAATTRRWAAGAGPALAVQVIHAPVFHGHTFSIAVELERAVEISRSKRR
jgi:aspartate-semialdehyde dehydrogenase